MFFSLCSFPVFYSCSLCSSRGPMLQVGASTVCLCHRNGSRGVLHRAPELHTTPSVAAAPTGSFLTTLKPITLFFSFFKSPPALKCSTYNKSPLPSPSSAGSSVPPWWPLELQCSHGRSEDGCLFTFIQVYSLLVSRTICLTVKDTLLIQDTSFSAWRNNIQCKNLRQKIYHIWAIRRNLKPNYMLSVQNRNIVICQRFHSSEATCRQFTVKEVKSNHESTQHNSKM